MKRKAEEARWPHTYSIRLSTPQIDRLHRTAIREHVSTARLVRRLLAPVIDNDGVVIQSKISGECS